MQNKGFVKVLAVLLTLVCLFYMSFSFVSSSHMSSAKEDPMGQQHYLDSMSNEKVWLGYTLKECQELEIGLGLDLKGGMSVTMEVSVPDVVSVLAGSNKEPVAFKAAFDAAREETRNDGDFIASFIEHYNAQDAGKVAAMFTTEQLNGKVSLQSTDQEVADVLAAEVKASLDNSFNVLRSRIDRFGVVQPNMQSVEGARGRILIELPGVTDKDRVERLLQGSANLQFWETFSAQEIAQEILPALNELNETLVANEETALFPALVPQTGANAIVGHSLVKDTMVVNNAIARAFADQTFMKEDIRFAWSVSPIAAEQPMYVLYAL